MSGLSTAELDALSTKLKTDLPYLSLHSAAPATSGNEIAGLTRQAANWVDDGSGKLTATNVAFTGMAANATVAAVAPWSAATAGTLGGPGWALTGDTTANASGAYTVTSLVVQGSST